MIISKKHNFINPNTGKQGIIIRGKNPIIIGAFNVLKRENSKFEAPTRMGGNSEVEIGFMGAFSYFCDNSYLRGIESIGRFTSISSNFVAGLPEHPTKLITTHGFVCGNKESNWYSAFISNNNSKSVQAYIDKYNELEKKEEKIVIGNDVWIGRNVTIMGGVRVGNGAVIGSGAIVTKDVPPYSVVAGVPAKVIRKRFSDNIIATLEKIQWWEYGPDILMGISPNVEEAILELEERIIHFPKWKTDIYEFTRSDEVWLNAFSGERILLYREK